MHKAVIGWDVGGAHLKASLLDAKGCLQQVLQVPCALWRGLAELETAIDVVLAAFAMPTALHAITMTGELVDLFQNRKQGVQAICAVMDAKLKGEKRIYAGALNADYAAFVTLNGVEQQWPHIASANWLASASFAGRQVQHGLLMDIGSTTSDFVLLQNQSPVCQGFTDASRMQADELVYAGVVRTPLMAVAQKVRFANRATSVAAEYFATTADVYRLTGDLAPADDMADTADGNDKTPLASARRIARMIGHDVEDFAMDDWIKLAHEFKAQQVSRLKTAAAQHLARLENTDIQPEAISIIGAGAGSFLAKEVAQALHVQYMDVMQLIEINVNETGVGAKVALSETRRLARVCLPAYAVAYLAYHQ